MFRPNAKNQAKPANYRLPKMQKILTDTDLQFILGEAQNKMGTVIEMPFSHQGGATYMLTVVASPDTVDPMWTYYAGEGAGARILWQHPTGDVNLVLNLCAAESGGVGEVEYTASAKNSGVPQHLQKTTSNINIASNTYSSLTTLSGVAGNAMIDPNATIPMTPMSPTTSQITNPAMVGKTASLEGDIANMQVPTLLQSISMSKMTGKLVLQDKTAQAFIYFFDGNPTHAVTDESTGDPAIVEMITWEEGQFHFYPNEQTNDKTVKRRVDSMLMEGVTLLDQNKFLKEQGLKPNTYLYRKNPNLTEEEFGQLLQKGAPLDVDTQKRFYAGVEGAVTLLDMLRKMPMVKLEWIPIMFNMLACNLLGLSDTAPQGAASGPQLQIPPFPIDKAAIQAVARTLVRPETGIFTYPAFLYFLEQEFAKSASMGMPLSVVVFDLNLRVGHEVQPMPLNFAKEVLRRMESVKRPFDTLGHFETFGYALFMPNTPTKGAKVFGSRLVELLGQDSGIPKLAGQAVLTMGISAAPEDTMDLASLLSAAKEAKRRGIETGTGVTVFRDIVQR
jgi:GGDEF domain-containing protein